MACPITLSIADSALAARLYDPTGQFWTQAERLYYIQEAMREWNALTGFWHGDFLLTPANGTQWYDITNTATAPLTLRALTLNTTYLNTIIQYHLLEPPVGLGAWTGSAQLAPSDIQTAIARRRDEILGITGCNLTRSLINASPGRTALANTTLGVRRVAFIPAPGFGSPTTLWQDDSWAWQAYENNYATLPAGIPFTYALSTQPVFSFDVDRLLNVAGQYELLTMQSGADPSLAIPDDWTWVLKWGALADLLGRESNAKDAVRAAYCEKRYRDGLALLALAPAVLGVRSDNIPLQIDSVRGADQYQASWEAAAAGPPKSVLAASMNLLALSPTPDAGPYSLMFTVIQNAPVPSAPSDCITLTQDAYEVMLDEAQHIAMFKSGGAEFAATLPLHKRFLDLASFYSSKLAEMGEFSKALYHQSQQEQAMNPFYDADSLTEVEANG